MNIFFSFLLDNGFFTELYTVTYFKNSLEGLLIQCLHGEIFIYPSFLDILGLRKKKKGYFSKNTFFKHMYFEYHFKRFS